MTAPLGPRFGANEMLRRGSVRPLAVAPACMRPDELLRWREVAGWVHNGTADPCAERGLPGTVRRSDAGGGPLQRHTGAHPQAFTGCRTRPRGSAAGSRGSVDAAWLRV